jgi:hypothetical protein
MEKTGDGVYIPARLSAFPKALFIAIDTATLIVNHLLHNLKEM